MASSSHPIQFRSLPYLGTVLALLFLGMAVSAWALTPTTTLVTPGFDGSPIREASTSFQPAISSDGRFVVFQSSAIDFVPIQLSSYYNLFVKDMNSGAVELVNVSTGGVPSNGRISSPSISGSGRYIAFQSTDSQLVPNDSNDEVDIFVRDRQLGTTERVSLGPGGVEANGESNAPAISEDGRFVVFESVATNLISGGTSPGREIYVRDLQTGTTELVSRDTGSTRPQKLSDTPSISADGRYIAFRCERSNSASSGEILLRDRQQQTTELISQGYPTYFQIFGFRRNPVVSANGQFVAFSTNALDTRKSPSGSQGETFVRDRVNATTEHISVREGGVEADSDNFPSSISGDGRYISFRSSLQDYSAGHAYVEVGLYVRDRQQLVTTQVGPYVGDERFIDNYENRFSSDGRFLTFSSSENGLVEQDTDEHFDVFRWRTETGVTSLVSISSNGDPGTNRAACASSAMSADGRFLVFRSTADNLIPGDNNGYEDVFVKNRVTGAIEIISVSSNETPANGDSYSEVSISADGRFVAFCSNATNLVENDTNRSMDVFVRDRQLGITERVNLKSDGSQFTSQCEYPSISDDGRFIAFQTWLPLSWGGGFSGTQIFVRNRQMGTLERITVDAANMFGSEGYFPVISGNGRYVAFYSWSASLIPDDTNGVSDVFVRDRQLGITERVSVDANGQPRNGESLFPSISADGRYVAFLSYASSLGSGDPNNTTDILVRDRQLGVTRLVSVGPGGVKGDYYSFPPAISANGRFVAFFSWATNLVENDTNNATDFFVWDLQQETTQSIHLQSPPTIDLVVEQFVSVSADGRFLLFKSDASDLVPNPTNGSLNVYLVDRSAAPTQLRATSLSSTRIRLDWNNARQGQTSFFLQRRLGSGAWVSLAVIAPTASSYVDTGLNPRTTYTYRLRSSGVDGHSAYSEEATATTSAPALPSTPTTLRVLNYTETSIALGWDDVAPVDETGYQLYRHTTATGWVLHQTLPANTTRFTDNGLTPNTRYAYYLRAVNNVGLSPTGNQVPIYTRPLQPTSFTARTLATTLVRLTWVGGSAGTVSYQLQRRAGAANWVAVGLINGVGTVNYDDRGLQPDTVYRYQLLAQNPSGATSGRWVGAEATTFSLAPTNLVVQTVSASALRLTWQDPSATERGFEVYRYGGGEPFKLVASPGANTTSYLDSGLRANTRYAYYVRVVNAGGASTNSNTAEATTAR